MRKIVACAPGLNLVRFGMHDVTPSIPSKLKFKFKPVETYSILKQLTSLQSKKASGLDIIPSRLLKSAAQTLAPSLSYNYSSFTFDWNISIGWKIAKVSPLL